MLHEEGEEHLVLEPGGSIRPELHGPEMVPLAALPAPVEPGAHDQAAVGAGALAAQGLEHLQGAEEVLRIEPAAHGEHGGLHILDVGAQVAGLPEGVVVGVVQHLVPEGHILCVLPRGAGGAQAKEPLVAVRGAVVEGGGPGLGGRGPGLAESHHEVEGVGQPEGAVAVEVVALEPVHDGRLGRDGLQGRVARQHARGGVEGRVADAPLADFPVVVLHVLHQPVDGVVGVRALVHGRAAGGALGPHVHEVPLGHHPAPHILVDEDEALLLEGGRRTQVGRIGLRAVGIDAVGSALEEEGIGPAGVPGGVDGREQLHPIAHGDEHLALVVLFPDRGNAGLRWHRRGRRSDQGAEQEDREERGAEGAEQGHGGSGGEAS